jgi:RNA polymerase sigma-70 factor (ECF subfamily)
VGEELEELRRHLVGVAYRVLGTVGESEDAVQEAFARYAAVDRDAILEPRAWLTTTTARICLDVLRSARVRREAYVGPWLPEPLVERLPGPDDPADEATRREDISLALLVVLETLTPEQRVAFVLHDVFAVPFHEVADVLHTSVEAARQLASRARRAVADGRVRHTASRVEQQRVLAAFLDAVAGGDLDRMLELLAPDVSAVGDGGGVVPAGRHPLVGADVVARFFAGLYRQVLKRGPLDSEFVLVNGDVGVYHRSPLPLVMAFAVADGRITAIYDVVNPAKLTRVLTARP